MKLDFTKFLNHVPFEQCHRKPIGMYSCDTTIHSRGFVMAVLQWHKVYRHGEDELHRAPVVALTQAFSKNGTDAI